MIRIILGEKSSADARVYELPTERDARRAVKEHLQCFQSGHAWAKIEVFKDGNWVEIQ